MFNPEFYPTPPEIISLMLEGYNFKNKTVLEPSAGRGDIVDALKLEGATVISCEKNTDLAQIVKSKSEFLKADFLQVTREEISHINFIVMNPPFSNADEHILHAWEVAPAGCVIIALMNSETLKNAYSTRRKELKNKVEGFGISQNLGQCFKTADRQTDVNITLVRLSKPADNYKTEFEGFFLEDEEEEPQENGIMSYNFIRDIVNRYVEAVKIFDKQLTAAVEMNRLTASFYSSSIALSIKEGDKDFTRENYKKDLQKNAWKYIFNMMNLNKYATRGLKEDINKFVEQQQNIPFTMKNIYKMLEIVIGTAGQRIDKAIIEVFDKITYHHSENRHNVKGWKTNSHFLVGKKFILPYAISPAKEYGYTLEYYHSLKIYDFIGDLEKALCFITGDNWDKIQGVDNKIRSLGKTCLYGDWHESHFFKFKGFKNGNIHFEYLSEDVWGLFNQNVARIKGYPLFEYKEQTAYQKRQTGREKQGANDYDAPKQEAKVLFKVKIN
jgi:hypothetical protein